MPKYSLWVIPAIAFGAFTVDWYHTWADSQPVSEAEVRRFNIAVRQSRNACECDYLSTYFSSRTTSGEFRKLQTIMVSRSPTQLVRDLDAPEPLVEGLDNGIFMAGLIGAAGMCNTQEESDQIFSLSGNSSGQ